MLRKYTKTKTNFPSNDSLRKSIYLSVKEISKKWNDHVRDWGKILGQFMMFYEERFKGYECNNWGQPQTPEFIAFVYPETDDKSHPFQGKIRATAQVALLRSLILLYEKSHLYY